MKLKRTKHQLSVINCIYEKHVEQKQYILKKMCLYMHHVLKPVPKKCCSALLDDSEIVKHLKINLNSRDEMALQR